MRRSKHLGPWRLLIWLTLSLCHFSVDAAPSAPTVRVAVVGGLVLSGVWPTLCQKAELATGLRIETVAAAPKEGVVPAFRKGEAELLLIHGSDETYGLQAAGLAAPLRAWAMNEHVIVGPDADPAGVAQASDAADALRRIIAANAPMMGFRDPGSFAIVAGLMRAAGLRPGPRQQLFDDSDSAQGVLRSAAANSAYVVVGHIPVAFGKMPSAGMRILLKGDPAMRRVYVAVEPGPQHPASARQRAMAHRLAAYLLSARGQSDLAEANLKAGGPWVFPVMEASQPGASD